MSYVCLIGSGGEQPNPGGSAGPPELSGDQDPEGGGQTQREAGQTQQRARNGNFKKGGIMDKIMFRSLYVKMIFFCVHFGRRNSHMYKRAKQACANNKR